MSIEDLAANAKLIIRGKVVSKSCQRDSEGRIYTKVELSLSEVWKGTWTESGITVVHGGGTLGEERVLVPGQVNYRIGDDSVLFLVFNRRGEAVTLAMAQGKFDVWRDPVSGEFLVGNPFHGGLPPREPTASTSLPAMPDRVTLQDLKTRVRKVEK